MSYKNTTDGFGRVAIGIHWLSALAIIGLFASGLYMRSLSYYDSLYQVLPFYHKSIGVVLFGLILFRLLWRNMNPHPKPLDTHSKLEKKGAMIAHAGLYVLMLAVMVAGYLISTAKGKPIDVFGVFELPATLHSISGQEDIAGLLHEYLAYSLIGVAVLHALGALKHHFIDKDTTLIRMLKSSN